MYCVRVTYAHTHIYCKRASLYTPLQVYESIPYVYIVPAGGILMFAMKTEELYCFRSYIAAFLRTFSCFSHRSIFGYS